MWPSSIGLTTTKLSAKLLLMKYDLRRPCPHCPFRTDGEGYLRADRAQEIATALARGAEFACHQTTVECQDDEGDLTADANSQFCAGALIALERAEAPNQAMRIAERLNLYDSSKLDMGAPVGTLFDFQRRHTDCSEALDPCHISGYGCEAPAGYLEGGVVIDNVVEIEIGVCEECWEPTCEECGKLVCVTGTDKFLCKCCQECYEDNNA